MGLRVVGATVGDGVGARVGDLVGGVGVGGGVVGKPVGGLSQHPTIFLKRQVLSDIMCMVATNQSFCFIVFT